MEAQLFKIWTKPAVRKKKNISELPIKIYIHYKTISPVRNLLSKYTP